MNKKIIKNKKFMTLIAIMATFTLFASACTNTQTNTPTQSAQSTVENTATQAIEDAASTATASMGTQFVGDDTLSLVGYGAKGALADSDLSLADMLTYAAQDEYLAHNEYAKIIDKFGDKTPYSNIIEAEETHLKELKDLYAAYGMAFPQDDSTEHLVIPVSLLEAAEAGVQAETDNIAMYERFLTKDIPDDVRNVFESLKAASENHLKAFQRQVDRLS